MEFDGPQTYTSGITHKLSDTGGRVLHLVTVQTHFGVVLNTVHYAESVAAAVSPSWGAGGGSAELFPPARTSYPYPP